MRSNHSCVPNDSYGDTALHTGATFGHPARIALESRIEDKLARLKHLRASGASSSHDESYRDTVKDLIGYLILYAIQLQE